MESPFVRLDREIQSLSHEDDSLISDETMLSETPSRSRSKGKGKDQALLRTILKQNLYSGDDPSVPSPSFHNSPLKPKGILKTPIPKHLNPYIAPNADPANWSGVVDLRNPSTSTTPRRFAQPTSRKKTETPAHDDSDDSWEGDLPPGMSPPVLMSPARPPRSSAELGLLKLGQTPSKEAAARISRDLVKSVQKSVGRPPFGYAHSVVESSMSTVPTPPSLSRYTRHNYDSETTDPSFDSAMSRVGAIFYPYAEERITPQGFDDGVNRNDDDDDSFSDDGNTMHPSAAFLLVPASQHPGDDSFDSSDSDDDGPVAFQQMHEVFDDDDSFDNSVSYDDGQRPMQDTDTVFGLRANEHRDSNELRFHNLNVFDDTTSMSAQLGRVDSSPTPANWDRK